MDVAGQGADVSETGAKTGDTAVVAGASVVAAPPHAAQAGATRQDVQSRGVDSFERVRAEGASSTAAELAEQVAQMGQENMALARQLVELEEMNSAMMTMYVSSYNLHASLDPGRVVATIAEIVINFVGAESFAVLLREEDSGAYCVAAGEDHLAHMPEVRVQPQGLLGAVVASLEPFVHTGEGPPGDGVLAAVPLCAGTRVVGAVVIFKLLRHKARLKQSDVELLHLLGTHAATALVSAQHHAKVDRKLKTLEGLLGLLRASPAVVDRR